MKLIEEVRSQVITVLKAGLPTRLAALESEYNDGTTLESPYDEDYYDLSIQPPLLNVGYPAVLIMVGNAEFPDPVGFGDGGSSNEYRVRYPMIVSAVVSGSDVTELDRRLCRYGRAIVEVLTDGYAFTGQIQCMPVSIGYESPYVSDSRDSGDLIQDIPVQFVIDTLEDL